MDQVTNLQYSESWSGTDYYDLLTEGDSEMTSVNESKSFPIPCAVKPKDLVDIKNLVPYRNGFFREYWAPRRHHQAWALGVVLAQLNFDIYNWIGENARGQRVGQCSEIMRDIDCLRDLGGRHLDLGKDF